MQQKPMSAAVAHAVAGMAREAGVVEKKRTEVAKRRLTVDIKVEAESADDSYLAPLVVEALQEFMQHQADCAAMAGKFESRAGLDVTWSARNEYFDAAGNPVAHEEKP